MTIWFHAIQRNQDLNLYYWRNFDWLKEIDKNTRAIGVILNTVKKILSCEKSVLINLYALKFFIYEKSFMSSEYPIIWMLKLIQVPESERKYTSSSGFAFFLPSDFRQCCCVISILDFM